MSRESKYLMNPSATSCWVMTQPIDVEFFIIFLYREVATLVNNGNGIILERLHVCQCLCSHPLSSGRAGRSCLPSAVSQGRWGLKPVAAELQGAERIQQAEGIIQVGSVLAETVAVVPFFQSPAGFVVGDVVIFGYPV